MATRKRIRSINPNVTNPGGGSAVTGNVAWGPDFGEASGADGITWTTGVNIAQPALALVTNKGVGVQVAQPMLALVGDKRVGTHCAGTALGAPFWQSVANAENSNVNSITCNKPSGTVEGDLLVAHLVKRQSATTLTATPSGWTLIQAAQSPGATPMTGMTWYKIAGASEPTTYTWNTGSGGVTIEIHRLNGTDATTPINVSAINTLNATALVTDPVSPSVTTTVVNCMVFSFLAHDHAALSNTHTEPSGFIERLDFETTGLSKVATHTFYRVYGATGSTGSAVHDCTETVATDAVMTRIAIAPGTVTLAI